jgi:hypothetical protein
MKAAEDIKLDFIDLHAVADMCITLEGADINQISSVDGLNALFMAAAMKDNNGNDLGLLAAAASSLDPQYDDDYNDQPTLAVERRRTRRMGRDQKKSNRVSSRSELQRTAKVNRSVKIFDDDNDSDDKEVEPAYEQRPARKRSRVKPAAVVDDRDTNLPQESSPKIEANKKTHRFTSSVVDTAQLQEFLSLLSSDEILDAMSELCRVWHTLLHCIYCNITHNNTILIFTLLLSTKL